MKKKTNVNRALHITCTLTGRNGVRRQIRRVYMCMITESHSNTYVCVVFWLCTRIHTYNAGHHSCRTVYAVILKAPLLMLKYKKLSVFSITIIEFIIEDTNNLFSIIINIIYIIIYQIYIIYYKLIRCMLELL